MDKWHFLVSVLQIGGGVFLRGVLGKKSPDSSALDLQVGEMGVNHLKPVCEAAPCPGPEVARVVPVTDIKYINEAIDHFKTISQK